MTDARVLRTRAALHEAVLDLATQKPAPSITVSELAAAARINRVTFYKHYATPSETLAEALTESMDQARQFLVTSYAGGAGDPMTPFVDSVDLILDLIEAHRDVFLLSVQTPQDGSIPNLLADHFTGTLRQYLAERAKLKPELPALDIDVVSRFFAFGLVGALKTWVLEGLTDRGAFLQSVIALAPTWWFPADLGDNED